MPDEPVSSSRRPLLWSLRIVVAVAFLLAGAFKLTGNPMMVAVFKQVGVGDWFRYVTGVIEVGGAVLLLTPRFAGAGSALLLATAIGAVMAHLTVVPGSPAPAALLVLLTGILTWCYRAQILALVGMAPQAPIRA